MGASWTLLETVKTGSAVLEASSKRLENEGDKEGLWNTPKVTAKSTRRSARSGGLALQAGSCSGQKWGLEGGSTPHCDLPH